MDSDDRGKHVSKIRDSACPIHSLFFFVNTTISMVRKLSRIGLDHALCKRIDRQDECCRASAGAFDPIEGQGTC